MTLSSLKLNPYRKLHALSHKWPQIFKLVQKIRNYSELCWRGRHATHYNDVIMSAMASQITCLTTVYSTVYLGVNQRKHQSSVSLAFVRNIHRWPVNSTQKGPVTRKKFPSDDVIMMFYLQKGNGKRTFRIVFLILIVLRVAKTSSDIRSIQLPVDD